MLGTLIGGLAGMASARKQKRMIEQQGKDNESWYNQRYNESSLERADAQQALTNMRNAFDDRSKQSRGISAVMGGTNEQAAIEKQAQNKAIGKTLSNLNAQGEARKSNVESQYLQRKDNINQQLLQNEQQRASSIQQAASALNEAESTAMNVLMPGSGLLTKKK